MPPQLTNIRSETQRDAAGLGLDLPIAMARNAMNEALAAAGRTASIAALDGALSDRETTGAAAASTQSVIGLLKRYWRAFWERRQRQSLRADLAYLSDRELMDIGLTRSEIDYLTPERAIDRLRDNAYLWSRGVM